MVDLAYQYLKRRRRRATGLTPPRLRHIELAREIRTSLWLFSIALEAGALARHAPEPLAASFAMPEELLTVLERLFFDVRDRLGVWELVDIAQARGHDGRGIEG